MPTALEHLKYLISVGYEFPDALWRTTREYKLSMDDVEELTRQYDNQ